MWKRKCRRFFWCWMKYHKTKYGISNRSAKRKRKTIKKTKCNSFKWLPSDQLIFIFDTCVYAQQMDMMKMKTKMTMYGPLISLGCNFISRLSRFGSYYGQWWMLTAHTCSMCTKIMPKRHQWITNERNRKNKTREKEKKK